MSYTHLDTIGQRFSLHQVIIDNGISWQIIGVRASEESIWYDLACAHGRWRVAQEELIEQTAQQEIPFDGCFEESESGKERLEPRLHQKNLQSNRIKEQKSSSLPDLLRAGLKCHDEIF